MGKILLHHIIYVLALLLISIGKTSAQNISKPNVILINADDFGRGLLSHEGQQIIPTPNIDRLAREGMQFKNFYSPMFCAPARASLLTGYNDVRTDDKWQLTSAGIYKRISNGGLDVQQIQNKLNATLRSTPETELFLADVFKKAGYQTAQIGKLGWGFATSFQQMEQHGWDYYYGYLDHQRAHGFYPPFLFENDRLVEIPGNTHADVGKSPRPVEPMAYQNRWSREGKTVYSQDLFMNKVKSFMQENKDQPFFLYFPTQLPHGPVAIPAVDPTFIHNDSLTQIEKEYASMVTRLDRDVGTIMSELKRHGIEDNTMVIFASDNGHEIYYSKKGRIQKPYRNMNTGERFNNVTTKYYSDIAGDVFNGNDGMAGMKRSNWEGGVRVPFIIKWPGYIQEGTVSHNLTAVFDLLPTFTDLLDVKVSEEKDGKSFLPELLGRDSSQHRKYVAFSSFMGPALVTNDGWKLRYYAPKKIFQLYYLPDDYKESNNLAAQYPSRVKRLKKVLLEKSNGNLGNGWFRHNTHITPVR